MSIISLLTRLKELDIDIGLVDDNLKINAPEGALTPGLITQLKGKKEEIILFLKNLQKQDKFASIEPAPQKDAYPLSSPQRRLYLLQQMEPDNVSYNLPLVLLLETSIDMQKLESAFKGLIQRHESLRTSFLMQEEKPLQKIHETVPFEIEYLDMSAEECGPGETRLKVEKHIRDFTRPFDLSRPPMLRAGLVKESRTRNILLLDMHHIITDGISQEILTLEFGMLYAGRKDLPPLRLQYKDYSQWINSADIQTALREQETFWLETFSGDIPVITLPTDFPRPPIQNFEGRVMNFSLEKDQTRALKAMARAQGATSFMVLLALYNLFLAKISGQEDIVVGTPVAGRKHVDLKNIIGVFVNTLALRNFPSGNKSFTGFLKEVKEKNLSAFENQDFPFEELVEKTEVQRDMSRNPLFDVMFVWDDTAVSGGGVKQTGSAGGPGLSAKPYPYEFTTSKVDLTLDALENDQRFCFTFEYCTRLFEAPTIQRFVNYFKRLASSVIQDPGQPLRMLEVVPGEEKELILNRFNDTGADYTRTKTIHQLFMDQAKKTPGAAAVAGSRVTATPGGEPMSLTYSQFDLASGALAQQLAAKGLAPGDIAGIALHRSMEMFTAIFAVLKAGAAYLPIDPGYPPERIRFILEDSGAKLLITSQHCLEDTQAVKPSNGETITIEDITIPGLDSPLSGGGGQSPPPSQESTSPAYVIYTSGTTGKPKGVIIEHHSLVNRLEWMQKTFPLDANDTILHKTPFTFDVSVWEIFWWSMVGAGVFLLPPGGEKEPNLMTDAIQQNHITTMHFVPSMLSAFLDHVEQSNETHKLTGLKRIIASGEALTPAQVDNFNRLLYKTNRTRLANLYGPTEATIDVSYFNCSPAVDVPSIPIGKPIDNIKLFILDKHDRIQPIGVSGELCIAGTGVGRGYLNRPGLTSEKFVPNPHITSIPGAADDYNRLYRTGDLARWLPDGNIEFIGRIDHQVKIRGFRIECGEIENRLTQHEKIKEAVVIDRGSNDDDSGDRFLCAYIVSGDGIEEFLPGLRDFLSLALPSYMIPAHFVRIESIPLTANGKLDRKALPKPETRSGEDYVPPQNQTETDLAGIWQEVLSLERVSTNDNFFYLGGDSIKAIKLLSRVNLAFQTDLRAIDLTVNDTIKKLSLKVQQQQTTAGDDGRTKVLSHIEGLKKRVLTTGHFNESELEDIYPMSDIEKGMIFYSLKDSESALYHDQFPYILEYTDFDPQLFKDAMILVAGKHDILRAAFNIQDFEEPVQIVYNTVEWDIKHEDISHLDASTHRDYLVDYMAKDRKTPFDITTAPLWRIRTFSLGKNKVCAMWIFHHSILDGWSAASVVTELHNTYINLKNNLRFRPEKLKANYKTYVVEQLVEKSKQENIDYWRNELDEYKRLQLPGAGTARGPKVIKRHITSLGPDRLEQLKTVARDHGTNLKNVCFAAYIFMLSTLCQENDVVAGLVTDNRPITEDGEKILGCFLNTLPIRVRIPSGLDWSGYIRMIDRKLVEITRYNRISFNEIVRIIGEKTQEENPIFDTLLNFTDFHIYNQAFQDDKAAEPDQAVDSEEQQDPHGFSLDVYENTNTLFDFTVNTTYGAFELNLSYTTSALDTDWVLALCRYYENILDKFIKSPEAPAKKILIMREEEKKQLIYDFNDTKKDYSRDKTLHQMFEEQVEKAPGNIAVSGPSLESGEFTSLTYDQFNRKANQLAFELRKRGVSPNRFIGVTMERSIEMVISVMAIIKAGGAYVPLETYLPEARLVTCITTSSTEWIITNRTQLEKLNHVEEKLPEVKHIFCVDNPGEFAENAGQLLRNRELVLSTDLRENPVENPAPSAISTDIAYVIFTSGTTGVPKGVVEQHQPVVNIIEWVNETFDVGEKDKQLFVVSLSFDLSVYDIFGLLACGGSVRVVDGEEQKSPEGLLDIIFHEGITFWDSAPAALQQLIPFVQEINDTRHYEQESRLRIVFLSGDWIPLPMPDILKQGFKRVNVIALGGGTEATIWSNFYPVGAVAPEWKSIPYGKPIQNAQYYILDEYLNPCPIAIPGDLYIGGECLAIGYLNDPVLSDKKFIDNPYVPGQKMYRTGDMARWFPDGNMEFLGRKDSQVKIRGFRIELGEVESQLLAHDDVKEAVVLAKGEARGDRFLCAYYVPIRELSPRQLSEFLAETLPEYMIPPYFIQLEAMPVTSNGKLNRKALPDPDRASTAAVTPPRDNVQKKIAEIWADVLAIDAGQVGLESNFFELGGHSLNATIMVPRIHKALDVRVPLSEIFVSPTLDNLAQYIKQAELTQFSRIEPVEKREYYPLSSAQKRMFLLAQIKGMTTSDNTPFALQVNGPLDIDRLETALHAAIRRHESLRTTFHILTEEPAQVIHDTVDFEIEHRSPGVPEGAGEETVRKGIETVIHRFITPFDLSHAPLFRVGVLKLEENRHILMYDMHHIINDDISTEVFINDVVQLYAGLDLPSLNIQYKDFAAWQNRLFEAGVAERQKDYWLGMYSRVPQPLELPTDFPRPDDLVLAGDSLEYRLHPGVSRKFQDLAQQSGATLYMILIAIYNILLSRYSGQEDIVIGTPSAGRPHTDLESIIGMFINTLAMRNTPMRDKTFAEFLEEVKNNTLRAFENQDFQFEELVGNLELPPDSSRNPLFDTMFTLVMESNLGPRRDGQQVKYEGLSFSPYTFSENVTQFDISIHAYDDDEGVLLHTSFATSLFKPGTIEDMHKDFEEIALQVTENTGIRLKDIRISHHFSDAHSSILAEAESDFDF